MGNTCSESSGAAVCAASDPAGGRGTRGKSETQRKRLLRRAAVGIIGSGWVFFGAPGMGDAAAVRVSGENAFWLESVEDASFGVASLSVATPSLARIPLADAAGPGWEPALIVDDTVGEQFAADVRERLPQLRAAFELAGHRSGLDWRLIAAMAYQESSWDPDAVSPTGVRGIMMLTVGTADELDVDRENPAESIQGGAAYFEQIMEDLPPQIREPDRTDMALAAYNVGIGHLNDARKLAALAGSSPNRWHDVRAMLPLLTEERWFDQTRHGYARGREAIGFVKRVRGYYGMLSSITRDGAQPPETATAGM